MEFRTCPACKASVLEDDVEDCPFCGASMSGKPSAKPAPKPAAKSTSPATKPTSPPPAKGPAPAKSSSAAPARTRPEPEPEKSADDADPFEVDPLIHKQAALISIKAGKGRTIEVKCPMCETTGFIAPSQAGKDVKCCNPSCRLPIFKAPRLPEVAKAEPEKAKGLSLGMIALLALLGVGLVGGGIYWFVLREEPKPKKEITNIPVDSQEDVPQVGPRKNIVVNPVKREITDLEEMRKLALDGILTLSSQHDIRSKALGRQLAAEALLTTGNLEGAKDQIAKIGNAAAAGPYAIEPLALLSQLQLNAGDRAGAEASVNEAVEKAAKLPDVLRSQLDAAVVLAAALVRLERNDEAEALLTRFSQNDQGGKSTLSELWRASLDQGTFDFGNEVSLSSLELCGQPLRVAAAVHLCRYGQWDLALNWSKGARDQVTRDASLAACVAMMTSQQARQKDPAIEAKLTAAIEQAPLAAKVRMRMAVAQVRWLNGDKTITLATASEAEQLLASNTIPAPLGTPGMLEIYESKGTPFAGLPDPAPGTSLALAYADIADLQLKLGDTAAGWGTLLKAMEMLRSVSPGPAHASHLFDQSNNNINVVKNQLDTLLKLGGDEMKKRRALSQYRGQCEDLQKIASNRFAVQQTILRRAMRYGLFEEVWGFIQEHDQAEIAHREPYRTGSPLIQHLYYSALSKSNRTFLESAWKDLTLDEQNLIMSVETTVGLLGSVVPAAQSGDFRGAAEKLKPLYAKNLLDRHLVDRHVLEQVSVHAKTSVASCYTYIQRLSDPTIREDSMRLLAGLAVQLGKAPELWKIIDEDREIPVTDKVSAYLGFLEGIQVQTGK